MGATPSRHQGGLGACALRALTAALTAPSAHSGQDRLWWGLLHQQSPRQCAPSQRDRAVRCQRRLGQGRSAGEGASPPEREEDATRCCEHAGDASRTRWSEQLAVGGGQFGLTRPTSVAGKGRWPRPVGFDRASRTERWRVSTARRAQDTSRRRRASHVDGALAAGAAIAVTRRRRRHNLPQASERASLTGDAERCHQ